jgi:hypothetical protein
MTNLPDYSYADSGPMKQKAEVGERYAYLFLQSIGYWIMDVRKDNAYQADDIDYLIKSSQTSTKILGVEVKTDSYIAKTQNLPVELFRLHLDDLAVKRNQGKIAKLGWSAASKADYLLVVDPTHAVIYRFRLDELRSAVQAYAKSAGELPLRTVDTDTSRKTVVMLMPLSAVAHKKYTPTNEAKTKWE